MYLWLRRNDSEWLEENRPLQNRTGLGNAKWIDKRHLKLPLTTKVIGEYLESWEDFMVRRVNQAKEFFIKMKIVPTLNKFEDKAKVKGYPAKNYLKVQEAIQKVLDEIKSATN